MDVSQVRGLRCRLCPSGRFGDNGNSDKILELIGDWEKLSLSNSFTKAQKELTRDNTKEFSIKKIKDGEWNWQELYSEIFIHEKKVRQPGEQVHSTFTVNNPAAEQIGSFSLSATNADISGIAIELNNYKKIQIPIIIKRGQTLQYTIGNELILYNADWKINSKIALGFSGFKVKKGKNSIPLNCDFDTSDKEANLKLEIRASVQHQTLVLRE